MCGIFGYVGHKANAAQLVLDGLKFLEYRGYDSWGVAVIPDDRSTIAVKKKTGKIGEGTVSELPAGSVSFGHTRWATHGGVTNENAHPHLDCTQTFAVIHNGIVENHEVLRTRLKAKGHIFLSGTDTEVIVHLVEEYAKTLSFLQAFTKAFTELEGLNAIILIHTKSREILAARNGSPLVVGFGTEENFLASDPAALLPHTKKVHFLEDDQMAIITDASIRLLNVKTGTHVDPDIQTLTAEATETHKGMYPYFMLKEIHDQSSLLLRLSTEPTETITLMAKALQKAQAIYMIGAGTSAHAARAGSYFFSLIAKTLAHVGLANEFEHRVDILPENTALMALSQSGETMDLLEIVKKAKKRHIKIFSMVNVVGSTLWRESDIPVSIDAGVEKAVASTKAFIATIARILLVAYAMTDAIIVGQNLLKGAKNAVDEILNDAYISRIQTIVHTLRGVEHMYIIGHGLSYCAAIETALKIKEISYIHAEGIPAGELKHGTLALVTKGTICMVFAPHDEHYQSTMANAMEMKARGGYIIGVSDKNDDVFDAYLPIANVGIATIMPNVIVGQLLAYYLTIDRGYDPDMPRNLAKSVTVK